MIPPEGRWTVPADLAALALLQEGAGDWLRQAGVDEAAAARVLLALDELAANIVHHAGLGADARFEVALEREAGELRVRISDAGRPFDPTAATSPPPAATLDEVSVGGFGLGLVRRLARSMDYRREDGRNHLRLRFAAGPARAAD